MKLDTLHFETQSEAEMVLEELKDIANAYGSVSISDYYELAGIVGSFEDTRYGWTSRDLYGVKVQAKLFDAQSKELDYYISLGQPNLINTKNNKEENTMPNYNYVNRTPVHPTNVIEESPESIEFEKKRKALMQEAEDKILDIRKELAVTLEKLETERRDAERVKREQIQAKIWKAKYDALVEAGFTTEQAWEMTMKSFEMD